MQQPLNKSRAESMAENEKREEIIKLYDQFIRSFLLEGNSILTDHELILTPEKIQGTRKCYISGFISNSTESFDEKIQKQFKDCLLYTSPSPRD